MTETKWTPGPWVYRPHEFDDWGYVRGQKDEDGFHSFICQAKDPRVTEEDENEARRNKVDPWAANAQLIAAAPEMADYIQMRADAGDTEAQRIMAKARGEQ